MSSQRLVGLLAALLVVALVVFAILDYDNHRAASVRALFFFWLTLLGGTALVGAGALLRGRHANFGTSLLVVGCLMVLIPTGGTIVLPLLALAVIALVLREHARAQRIF